MVFVQAQGIFWWQAGRLGRYPGDFVPKHVPHGMKPVPTSWEISFEHWVRMQHDMCDRFKDLEPGFLDWDRWSRQHRAAALATRVLPTIPASPIMRKHLGIIPRFTEWVEVKWECEGPVYETNPLVEGCPDPPCPICDPDDEGKPCTEPDSNTRIIKQAPGPGDRYFINAYTQWPRSDYTGPRTPIRHLGIDNRADILQVPVQKRYQFAGWVADESRHLIEGPVHRYRTLDTVPGSPPAVICETGPTLGTTTDEKGNTILYGTARCRVEATCSKATWDRFLDEVNSCPGPDWVARSWTQELPRYFYQGWMRNPLEMGIETNMFSWTGRGTPGPYRSDPNREAAPSLHIDIRRSIGLPDHDADSENEDHGYSDDSGDDEDSEVEDHRDDCHLCEEASRFYRGDSVYGGGSEDSWDSGEGVAGGHPVSQELGEDV